MNGYPNAPTYSLAVRSHTQAKLLTSLGISFLTCTVTVIVPPPRAVREMEFLKAFCRMVLPLSISIKLLCLVQEIKARTAWRGAGLGFVDCISREGRLWSRTPWAKCHFLRLGIWQKRSKHGMLRSSMGARGTPGGEASCTQGTEVSQKVWASWAQGSLKSQEWVRSSGRV